jgi:glycosyltransferase involved in cell wall biosynthesis
VKIGISTSVIQRGRSGVGRYVLSLVGALLDQIGRDELVLFVLAEDLPLFAFAGGRARIITVSERFRPAPLDIFWHQCLLPWLARKHGLDVLHVPSYRRLLWARPCALVATIHDLAPFRMPGKYDPLRMFYGRAIVPRLVRRQSEVLAVSRSTSRDIATFMGPAAASRTRVVLNGIDHDRFHPQGRDVARVDAAYRRGLFAPFFLYVARIEHPAKNHSRLISAFERFKTSTGSPWQLVLAGGNWSGAAVVHELIRRSPFNTDIRTLGFVPDAELPGLYRAAEVFVFPSLFEGFGLPPVEAMACGCPVLSSTRGALAEVVGDAALPADPENTEELAARLALLAGDETLRQSLRTRGLAHAARFDWRRAAGETLSAYADARLRAGSGYRAADSSPAPARPHDVREAAPP